MIEKYLIYKKDGIFAKELGGIHNSCFQGITNDEAILSFAKDGYVAEIIDDATYQNLLDSDLETAKGTKIAQIKQLRDRLIISDITTSKGLVFSADESSQFRIYVAVKEWNSLLTLQGLDPKTATYPWGSTGLVTQGDLQEAYLLIQARLAKVCGVLAPQLEAQVNACTSVEDILDKKGKVISKGVNSIQIQF